MQPNPQLLLRESPHAQRWHPHWRRAQQRSARRARSSFVELCFWTSHQPATRVESGSRSDSEMSNGLLLYLYTDSDKLQSNVIRCRSKVIPLIIVSQTLFFFCKLPHPSFFAEVEARRGDLCECQLTICKSFLIVFAQAHREIINYFEVIRAQGRMPSHHPMHV